MDPPPYDQAVQPHLNPNLRRLLTPDQVIQAREQALLDQLRTSPEYANLHDSIEAQLLDPRTKHPRAVIRKLDWQRELRIMIEFEYRQVGYRVFKTSTSLIISVNRPR